MAKVNPRRIFFLTVSEEGPTGRDVSDVAQEIVEIARDNVREIMRNYAGDLESILDDIDYEMEGTIARIGIRDGGSISRYLAQKEDREQVWLEPAVRQVLG